MRKFVFFLILSRWGFCHLCAGEVEVENWGELPDGRQVQIFTMQRGDLTVRVSDYGALLVEVEAPDREGGLATITPRLDSLADYLEGHDHMGTTIGRFANRIGGGGFEIDGVRYDLESVSPRTGVQLHGGRTGFATQLWKSEIFDDGVIFTLVSPDGHEGFPGEVEVEASYALTEGALRIDFRATTSEPTHVNLTNHVYWNLAGATSGDVLDHELEIAANKMLVFGEHKVPTGEIVRVANSPFDFRKAKKIGKDIAETDGGYDGYFVLKKRDTFRFAARLNHPSSGRSLELWTSQAGLQIYTGNHFSDKRSFAGSPYVKYAGIALEAQGFPDAPNKSEFPSTLLRPGEVYERTIEFRFGVMP